MLPQPLAPAPAPAGTRHGPARAAARLWGWRDAACTSSASSGAGVGDEPRHTGTCWRCDASSPSIPDTWLAAGMCSWSHHLLGGKVERRLPLPCLETTWCYRAGKHMELTGWRDAGLPLQPARQRHPWARGQTCPTPGFLCSGVSKVQVHKLQEWEPRNEVQKATGSFRCVES